MAARLIEDAINVTSIAPGAFASEMNKAARDHGDAVAQGHPAKRRIGVDEDMAGAAIFLASRAGDYVVGDTIVVDGGLVNAALGQRSTPDAASRQDGCGWCGVRTKIPSSTRHPFSRDRKFMPTTFMSPNAGETTTGRSRATTLPMRNVGTVAVARGYGAVGGADQHRKRFDPRRQPRRRRGLARQRGDRRAAVDQHPPFDAVESTRTQKCPSRAIGTRISSPTTCWAWSGAALGDLADIGLNRPRSPISIANKPSAPSMKTNDTIRPTTRNRCARSNTATAPAINR